MTLVTVSAILLTLAVTTGSAKAQTITTFDVPNATGTAPQSINLVGQIAGYYTDATGGGVHGFIRKHNGAITTFDADPQHPLETFAYGINLFGEVIGTIQEQLDTFGFIRKSNGTIIEWNASGQSTFAKALTEPGQAGDHCVVDGAGAPAINALGQSIGSVGIGCNEGYLRQPNGTFVYFQVAGPPETVAPQAINLLGQITGWYRSDSTYQGFLRKANGTILTFQVPNSTSMTPQGINFVGQIAGYYGDPNNPSISHGFLRQPNGTFVTFDPTGSVSTQVTAINDNGEITGSYATSDGIYHGFVRNRQGIIKSFDAVGTGNPGTYPRAINDNGRITGYYQDAGFILHGFVRSAR
ncbi:MAG TPA: hypothetical protein VGF44_17985 [Terriglobales bacterium]|jgi:hypothetical protein